MAKELKTQAKAAIGIEILWRTIAMNINITLPKVFPHLVKDAEVLEGDGGLGTVFLFKFGSGKFTFSFLVIFVILIIIDYLALGFANEKFLLMVALDASALVYQKEKIVELDESLHLIGLQVIEGGHLNYGFTSYKTIFQLTPITEAETLVDIKVVYDSEADDTHMPEKTTKSILAFIKGVETYLLNEGSETIVV